MIISESQEINNVTIQVGIETYKQLCEIATETGESIIQILDRLTEQAFLHKQEQKGDIILIQAKIEHLYVLCTNSYKTLSVLSFASFCPNCFTKERRKEELRVRREVGRAKRQGLMATLTIAQWLAILEYFDYHCAYCRLAKFELMDHVVAIKKGGGTVAMNCAPACISCNVRKDWIDVVVFPKDTIVRVKWYL